MAALVIAVLVGWHAGPARAGGTRQDIPVPVATWEELEPYIRANVVPFVRDGGFEVVVCMGVQDESTVDSFDQCRSDFATVLLLQALQKDGTLRRAFMRLGRATRADESAWRNREVAEYRSAYWQRLAASPHVYSRLQSRFEKALRRGHMHCWICEKDASVRPCGIGPVGVVAR